MKCKLGIMVTIATLTLSSAAAAADMPTKAPMNPISSYYDWTGGYVGANVGYGWVDGTANIVISGVSGTVAGHGSGILGGLQAGYNWQFRSLVLGVEADLQGTAQKGSFNGSAGANVFTSSSTVPWFGTIRGRLGYAFDRSLIYVTGGLAYGDGRIEGTSSVTGPFDRSRTFETYTVGGGIEQALFDRWTAKAEYLLIGPPNHVPGPPGTTAIKGSGTNQFARLGLNYRF